MPRPIRRRTEATWHHVMNRGARRLPIFGDDADRLGFLDRLAASAERAGVSITAYALMPNHFHLLVRGDVAPLGVAMQHLGAAYTRRFNVKYGLDGPLFRGRYRSRPIDDEHHLAAALRYIHRNPCPDGAGALSDFRWTSHLAYLGLTSRPSWLDTTLLADRFHDDTAAYRRFVEGDRLASDHDAADHAAARECTPRVADAAEVERAVGVGSEPERALLTTGGRGVRNDLRVACVLLCHEFTRLTAADLAERYGFASASSVRTVVQRAREQIDAGGDLAAIVGRARTLLAASSAPVRRRGETGL